MRTRLAVIMVADVVGYSRLMADDEEAGIAAVRELNQKYLDPGVSGHGGEVLKRLGDGCIIAFGSVHEAIGCALTVLGALSGHKNIKIRIGAHIGEIVEDDDDFYGAGVNLASRLQAEAPPGGLMVSQDLYRQLTGNLADKFESAGNFELKNIPYPVEGFQWRPPTATTRAISHGEVPGLMVQKFDFAPADPDTESAVSELRDQLLMYLARRTGIKTIDASADRANSDAIYDLRGRMRIAGGKARLNVVMKRTDTDEAVFSRNYDGDMSDFFSYIDDTVSRVNSDIRAHINAHDAERLADLPDDELSVSELRSRAATSFYQGTYEGWLRARDLMDRALTLNPDDAMALAMRVTGDVFLAAARYETLEPDVIDALERDANAAIERSPQSDFAFATRSVFNSSCRRDAKAAIRDAERALNLSPDYFIALSALGQGQMLAGDFDAAMQTLERTVDIGRNTPFEGMWLFEAAICRFCRGEYRRAAELAAEAIHLLPKVRAFHRLRSISLEHASEKEAAGKAWAAGEKLSAKPMLASCRPSLPPEFDDLLARLAPDEPH